MHSIRVLLVLCLFPLLGGCDPSATVVPFPDQSSIPTANKFPIDGTWKLLNPEGSTVFKIEGGRMYIYANPGPRGFVGAVTVKDIRQVTARTYTCMASAVHN